MDIRPATAPDIPEIAALWCTAFPGKRTEAERARMLEVGGRYGGLETVLVAREDGRLAGAAKIYALTQHLTGVALPMMGLAAVATDPAMRRRGIAARLCAEGIRASVARGDVVSVLYPFRPDYYERLGWGLVGRLVEHRFATAALPAYPGAAAVRPARLPEDLEGIAACYAAAAERGHGPIARDRRVWAYRLSGEEMGVRPVEEALAFAEASHPLRAVLVHDDGGIGGYALIRYVPADRPGRRTVVVRELVATRDDAYRGLLGHLAGLAASWPRAKHFARPEERFDDRLTDPRPPGFRSARSLYFPTGRIVQGPMLRILDVPAALARRRWFDGALPAPARAEFAVSARDDVRPENTGTWVVRVEEGGADAGVEPVGGDGGAGGVASSGTRLSAGISTLSRIWAGELSPSAARRLGRAELSGDERLLDAAFGVRETFWLLDEF